MGIAINGIVPSGFAINGTKVAGLAKDGIKIWSGAPPIELLDWVQFSGEQWIDTGLMSSGDYIFEDVFLVDAITTPKGDGNWIIGARKNVSYALGIFRGSSGLFNAYGGNTKASATNVAAGQWVEMYFSRETLRTTVNGQTQTYTISGGNLVPEQYAVSVLLGKNNMNYTGTGDDPRNMYGKRKSTKITDAVTGTVLRDFQAARFEGYVGFYDTANNVFYRSAGPSEFPAGPTRSI